MIHAYCSDDCAQNRHADNCRAPVTLWSKRYSVARGEYWVAERMCQNDKASEWLALFQRDEPGVEFRIAARRPRA